MNVSIAEVGDVERHQLAQLGVVTVARESSVCHRVLNDVRRIASTLPDAVLADVRGEILSLGEGGIGLRGGIEELLGAAEGWYVDHKEDG